MEVIGILVGLFILIYIIVNGHSALESGISLRRHFLNWLEDIWKILRNI